MQVPHLLKTLNTAPVAIGRADLHELVVAYGMEQFALKGRCPPTWIIAAGPNIAWFVTDWANEREKALNTGCMRLLMEEVNASSYSLITEAYIANVRGKSEEEIEQIASLADLPSNERDDVLFVTTFDRAGGYNITRFLVTIRQPVGPNFLGPRVDEDEEIGGMQGRMWNLLNAA
jgi:hypothetical protein